MYRRKYRLKGSRPKANPASFAAIDAVSVRSPRQQSERLAPLEVAVRHAEPLVQGDRRAVRVLVELALPVGGASIRALVAEEDPAAERALLVLAAETAAQVR